MVRLILWHNIEIVHAAPIEALPSELEVGTIAVAVHRLVEQDDANISERTWKKRLHDMGIHGVYDTPVGSRHTEPIPHKLTVRS